MIQPAAGAKSRYSRTVEGLWLTWQLWLRCRPQDTDKHVFGIWAYGRIDENKIRWLMADRLNKNDLRMKLKQNLSRKPRAYLQKLSYAQETRHRLWSDKICSRSRWETDVEREIEKKKKTSYRHNDSTQPTWTN